MPQASRTLLESKIAILAKQELERRKSEASKYDWARKARPNQLPPEGNWLLWLILAGRGFGKTRTGAEWVRSKVDDCPRIALIGPTASDCRDVMVKGESGLLAIFPQHRKPVYEPSKRVVTFHTGAQAFLYSSEEPDRLRGPQHHAAWCDEIAGWKSKADVETWDNMLFGLRLGESPQAVVTTTPKPRDLVRRLVKDAQHITRGSSYDNRANLAPGFFTAVISQYEGTRLGRQEIEGELVEDTEGALWTATTIDLNRVTQRWWDYQRPEIPKIAIGVDPAGTSSSSSDETGIVAVALGADGHLYTLGDDSGRYRPLEWASRAVEQYRKHRANVIVGETNFGGEMVEQTLKTIDPNIPFRAVHASRGKTRRAEPIASLAEQGKEHHVGTFPRLEDQMTTYVEGVSSFSPDRMDAKVWAATHLLESAGKRHPAMDIRSWQIS